MDKVLDVLCGISRFWADSVITIKQRPIHDALVIQVQ